MGYYRLAGSSADDLRAELAAMRQGALPICCVTTLSHDGNANRTMPAIHVDATGAPQVADLARVVNTDGGSIFQASAGWRFVILPEGVEGVLDVELLNPVRCLFTVAISIQEHRGVLEAVLAAQAIVLSFACWPADGGPDPSSFILTVRSHRALREALDLAAVAEARS